MEVASHCVHSPEDLMNRRTFLQMTAAAAGATAVARLASAASTTAATTRPPLQLKKAIKLGGVGVGKSLDERFAAIRAAGFTGVEADSPAPQDRSQIRAASQKAGVKIHGVVDAVHWQHRLSDPDESIRARGLAALKTALADASFYGADTVLLVPGKVSNPDTENFQQVWDRSTEQVKQAIPTAEETGVKIAIEVVWNNFITRPDQLVQYVDQFKSPMVGAYFDVSNMIKFGVPPAQWIRTLGPRMLKFDFKGYSNKSGWVKIGDGDEDWPAVLAALSEIRYTSWATAEVNAPTEQDLTDISQRMRQHLGV
jgi:hexulose-6-phosphate isomerase